MTTQTTYRGACDEGRASLKEKFQFFAACGLYVSGLINIGYFCVVFWA